MIDGKITPLEIVLLRVVNADDISSSDIVNKIIKINMERLHNTPVTLRKRDYFGYIDPSVYTDSFCTVL